MASMLEVKVKVEKPGADIVLFVCWCCFDGIVDRSWSFFWGGKQETGGTFCGDVAGFYIEDGQSHSHHCL